MRQRWLVLVAVASLALNLAVVGSFLFLWLRAPAPPPLPLPGIVGRDRERLERMRREYGPCRDSLRERIFRARRALLLLAAEQNPSSAAVDSLLGVVGSAEAGLARLSFEHARRIGSALPPAAREEFFRRLQTRSEPRRGPRWDRRLGRPCPPPEDINP